MSEFEREEAVWRVCRITSGKPCLHCPLIESIDGEEYVRGCVASAAEVINVVETGNPWRKTHDVKPPWDVI